MNSLQFRKQRESQWMELEQLMRGRKTRFRQFADLSRFAELYQTAASDLAYARTYFPNDAVTEYLNMLVSTAHQRLYREQEGGFSSIGRFLVSGFPQMFRRFGGYILISALVFLFAAIYGFVQVWFSPVEAYALLPPSLIDQIQPSQVGPHEVDAPIISSYIMTHNIMVCLLAFTGGITLGLFTLYSLWQNGLILGVLAAILSHAHKSLMFWSLIVPHGVTELLAIFISGGAGLLFAHRIVWPGNLRRITAIRHGLQHAVQLMLGVAPMLVIAGTIEGFLTPSPVPMYVKFGVAALSAGFWFIYFSMLGRPSSKRIEVHSQTPNYAQERTKTSFS
jgi:uncharacterized membrane protein SpoIIM required for sporulation